MIAQKKYSWLMLAALAAGATGCAAEAQTEGDPQSGEISQNVNDIVAGDRGNYDRGTAGTNTGSDGKDPRTVHVESRQNPQPQPWRGADQGDGNNPQPQPWKPAPEPTEK